MATEIEQAQAAPATEPAPAPATPSSGAAETTPTSQPPTQAELDAEFSAFYDPPAVDADAGTTEEQAPTAEHPSQDNPIQPSPDAQAPQAQAAEPEPSELPEKLRPRFTTPKSITIALIAKEKGIELDEATDFYRGQHPIPAAKIPGIEERPATLPPSVAIEQSVNALAAEVRADREGEGYLSAEGQDRLDRLYELKLELGLAKSAEAQAAREEQSRQQAQAQRASDDLTAKQDEVKVQVRKDYPSINNPKSGLYLAAQAVRSEMLASNDARLGNADAAQVIIEAAAQRVAEMCEEEQGIPKAQTLAALKAAATPAAPPAPAPLSPPAPVPIARRVTPAPGFKSQQNGNQPLTLGAAVAAANTPEEADRLFEEAYASGQSLALGRR